MVIVRGDVRVDVNFELTLSVALVQAHTIAHAKDVVMCAGCSASLSNAILYRSVRMHATLNKAAWSRERHIIHRLKDTVTKAP